MLTQPTELVPTQGDLPRRIRVFSLYPLGASLSAANWVFRINASVWIFTAWLFRSIRRFLAGTIQAASPPSLWRAGVCSWPPRHARLLF